MCCKIKEIDDVVNENPDVYWKCLDDDDRNWSIQEEENIRKNFEFRIMLDPSYKSLQSNRMGRCHLEGLHSYDLLRNPQYYNLFQYEAVYTKDREKYINDGDRDDSNNAF